eukprot:m.482060 g.482060  ORF g.482060 m.482060 type:complete len:396 (+) comp22419_c0_seq1:238-1425(+)
MRVLLAVLVTVAGSHAASNEMPLTLLTDDQGIAKGAVCLDGTNPGFYYRKSPGGTNATKWVLYFKGGGWCYTEESCASRSRGELGSSKHFPKTFGFGGVLEQDPSLNPFANFNHVIMWYCDGASFTGDRAETVNNTGTVLHFRGKRVLDAILDVLMEQPYNLGQATEVLLSGGSAGGLSTYIHADHVGSRLPASVTKFKAAPVSGFFLDHVNYAGNAVYPDEMKNVFQMQNSSSGVNNKCLMSLPADEQYKCIFANYSYAHTATAVFPLQSAIDSWQMGNVWQGDQSCAKQDFKTCTAAQVRDLNGYASALMADLKRTDKFSQPGNGGFVESCLEHCGNQDTSHFVRYAINGVTAKDAISAWWQSDGTDPASKHWYLPCRLSQTAPHQCNPTCDA